VAAQGWTFGASGVDTATWDGVMTLTDTVTATGAVLVTFSGQALKGLNGIPLPAMTGGSPS
jgi:hypothetical protein